MYRLPERVGVSFNKVLKRASERIGVLLEGTRSTWPQPLEELLHKIKVRRLVGRISRENPPTIKLRGRKEKATKEM